MNEETPTEINLLKDRQMSKDHRKRVLIWLRKMSLDKKHVIAHLVTTIETVRSNLNDQRARLTAELIAHNTILEELETWEDTKNEEPNRDSSPLP